MTGTGYANRTLTTEEVRNLVAQSIDAANLDGKRALMIIPDHTRTAPVDLMFRTIYECLADRAAALDVLVALGTHPPMPMEQIYERVGITAEEHQTKYAKTRFFNHMWKDPGSLVEVGVIPEEKIDEISNGLFRMSVKLHVNKLAMEYDHLMIVGPVFPHEVVGFSGGNKYLLPGIAGQEIIDFFHWLGAVITNPQIIGRKWNPVRKIVDLAASYIPTPKSCFAMVVHHGLAGLYYGAPEDAWSAAADLSDKLHIVYKDHPFHTALSCAPIMYDDLWTGGKCMYKLEPVVADGGKLIIYAPHIKEISVTHGKILEEIGYHTRDYFTHHWDEFKCMPWGVIAHSTHVRGIGTCDENGNEKPRIDVILATGIPEELCRKINLGYMNPANINVEDYKDREDEGILYVPKAGEELFRLRDKG